MHILLLNNEKGWRGGERQTFLCMQQFREQGHEVALIARKDQVLANTALEQGFKVYTVENVFQLCKAIWQNRKKYKIMHAQTANTLTWLALLKPFISAKIAFTRRTSFPLKKRKWLTKLKWRAVNKFYAISQASAKEPESLGIKIDKIIPSAVDAIPANQNNIESLREKFNLKGKKIIGTVAALSPEKDAITMIKAIDLLRKKRDDFIFWHLGDTGSLMAEAAVLVKSLNLQKHYIFAGFRNDVTDCYRLMDVFVISSIEEALGSSVLDAFLYKVPVVATKAGGLAEIISEGRGLGCDIGDSACIADKIDILLDDKDLCAKLTKKAHNYVINNNGVKHMAEQYLLSYIS